MSAFLVLSYLAFCIPALVAGFFAHSAGLVMTSNVYGAVVITLALIALASLIVRRTASKKKMPTFKWASRLADRRESSAQVVNHLGQHGQYIPGQLRRAFA